MLLLVLVGVASLQWHSSSAWLWGGKRCFGEMQEEYQCYDLKSPYTNTFGHYPKSPSDQNIQFKLFTTSNPTSPQTLTAQNENSVTSSNFDTSGKVAIVIHGFTDDITNSWGVKMRQELLLKVPNVIAVDWSGGAKGPNYLRAAANTRVVGAQLATLIHTLNDAGVSNSNIHLIGHSLGAHIAGYAGEKFTSDKIGRITGLDPAAPRFENFDNRVKLDSSDAAFVDVIHTDTEPLLAGGLGTVKRCGHVDIFPNGGHDMPGCSKDLMDLTNFWNIAEITENVACSHMRATDYFTASINDNTFLAYPCDSVDDRASCTSCGSGCNKMGYGATSSPSGLFVLDTGSTYPY